MHVVFLSLVRYLCFIRFRPRDFTFFRYAQICKVWAPSEGPKPPKRTPMGYAVFHATKGSGGGSKLGAHIDRDMSQAQTFKSADPERTHLNRDLLDNEYSKMKMADAINSRINGGYKGKKAIRKDAVKFIPMVMTGSPNEMKAIFSDNTKANAWVKKNYDFACKEFGKENIVRVTLHLDEKTPHLHIVAVPLTQDGRLSAKEVFGDVKKLSERQDRYSEAMSEFGLQRGIKGSKAVHTSEGWYIAKQKEAQKLFSDPTKQLTAIQRMNPYKKIEVLSEGLKLAVNHKYDSDLKAKREEGKVLLLTERNQDLTRELNRILGDENAFREQQRKKVAKIQQAISQEVRKRIDYSFSLHKSSPEEREKWVGDLIYEKAKEQKGITQELYNKVVSTNNFTLDLVERAEKRAEQNRDSDRGQDQKRNNGLRL